MIGMIRFSAETNFLFTNRPHPTQAAINALVQEGKDFNLPPLKLDTCKTWNINVIGIIGDILTQRNSLQNRKLISDFCSRWIEDPRGAIASLSDIINRFKNGIAKNQSKKLIDIRDYLIQLNLNFNEKSKASGKSMQSIKEIHRKLLNEFQLTATRTPEEKQALKAKNLDIRTGIFLQLFNLLTPNKTHKCFLLSILNSIRNEILKTAAPRVPIKKPT